MDDDLDTPGATALLFETVRRANAALDSGDPDAPSLVAAVHEICTAFGLVLNAGGDVPAEAAAKAAALDAARVAKDFAAADAIRAELQAAGWTVETTKAGTNPPPLTAQLLDDIDGTAGHVDVEADLQRGFDERLGGARLQAVAMPDDADLALEAGVEPADGDVGIGDRPLDGQRAARWRRRGRSRRGVAS